MKDERYPSIRLFKNDLLESFTHVHPILPLVLWGPVLVFLLHLSLKNPALSAISILVLFMSGVFLWTFIEYFLHRFAFHFPAKSKVGKRIVYLMHGLHHDDPKDPTRLVMPPVPAFIYAIVLFSFFKAVLGQHAVLPFFSGFLLGYLCYDYIHYYVHHFVPTNPVGKYLRKYHLVHHFKDHDAKWGVSSPLWDILLGTQEVKGSRTEAHKNLDT